MKTSDYFSEVSDPRVTGRCLHLLSDILLIGLCSYLTGGSDYQDMRLFGLECGSSLGDLLSLPHGVPSEDTFERVFKSINPDELESCLHVYGNHILTELSDKQIVIDGKKQRGVSPTTRGNRGLYLLNVWVSENRFCIAQKRVEDKSNEITAIPDALDSIDITDAVVSIDAMGTQREIADLIVEKNGHYLLALKNNQQSLFEDVECAFKMHGGYDVYETLEADHGRIETRKCSILPACEFLMEENLAPWKNLKTLIRLESKREVQGKSTQEVRYYISDEQETKAPYFYSLIRGHWSIENQLHWHLDVTFKEDACRARAGYASQNLSVLRKMALHIVSEQKDKHSIRKRLYKAALDIGYLRKLLKI
jgi:predicted transposase YbfD/YdcC